MYIVVGGVVRIIVYVVRSIRTVEIVVLVVCVFRLGGGAMGIFRIFIFLFIYRRLEFG